VWWWSGVISVIAFAGMANPETWVGRRQGARRCACVPSAPRDFGGALDVGVEDLCFDPRMTMAGLLWKVRTNDGGITHEKGEK
jgi:hypothetical protein